MINSVITSYYLESFKTDLKIACKKMKVDYDVVVGEKRVIASIPYNQADTSSFSSFYDVWGYDVVINIHDIDKMTDTGYEYLGCIKDDGLLSVHPNDNADFDISSMDQIKTFPCDRCGRNHSRNIIHVFRKDGKVTVYGSTCAKTKFGIDVNVLIAKFSKIKEQFGFADYDDMDTYGGFGKGWKFINADIFIPMSYYEIVEHGYVSASKVYDDGCGISTAETVESDYFQMIDGNNTIRKEFDWNTNNIEFDFDDFMVWAKGFINDMDSNDFKFNMEGAFTSIEEGYVHPRTKGFVSYLAFKFWYDNKKVCIPIDTFNEDYSDMPIGFKFKNLTVEIINEYTFEGNYGTTHIYTMKGVDDGVKYKWFASKELDTNYIHILTSGTVKDHENDVRYGKSCVITRCRAKAIVED